jgi:signal transduction histidine kinase
MNKSNKKPELERGTRESGGQNERIKKQVSNEIEQAAIDYDALKNSFISNVSHEIRTPLNAILGFSELSLQNGADLNEMLDYMKIIHNSSKELLQKMKDIIYVSTLEAGMAKYNPDTISMYGLMKDLHDYYKFYYRAYEKNGVEINVNLDNTKHFYFKSDAEKLTDLLKRLLDNGIKFTTKGSVELSLDQSKTGEVCFVVKDSGIGIPEDKLDLIFEPFATAQDLYSRNYNGSGLGLTIVRHLVNLMGGELKVQSVVDKGTEVRVVIPYIPIHKS